ncbi:exopolysaccharide biosynthesis protein [Maribellus comscasis]|uniref:Exopolysaccharide biosynthesis protein n=1 Tax=Maribellus comscasis TaxID=2681766 RepID=A0A6I6K292_9BACT|nr:Wzz/FepE/Etk N-terminal domain-containing protein [Maribellus comscasis]QGY46552.1 exopolysaccharide biosynthesis protein [Maribellus comscasis]
MSENRIKDKTVQDSDEIDLLELIKTVWGGRKTIIKTLLVFTLIGGIVAILSPKQFTASTTLVPQTSKGSSNLGGLSSLASMAGFNLNMSQGMTELTPQVYPQIIQSAPFQLEIMNSTFTFEGVAQPVSLVTYYTDYYQPGILAVVKKYTIGLPGVVLKSVRGEKETATTETETDKTTLKLTNEQEKVRKLLANNLSLDVNDKEGVINLSAVFHEPELAAQVTQKAKVLLQQYITDFRVEKAEAQRDFIQERYNEKKQEFEQTQAQLAGFRDRNKNVISALARTEEERLENEYQLAFNVYSELAQQLEQARIKVKEETPVFSIIKPVMIPLEKSKPNRPLILAVWVFLGLVAGIGWIFGKEYLAGLRESLSEHEKEEQSKKSGQNGYSTLEEEKERKLHVVVNRDYKQQNKF